VRRGGAGPARVGLRIGGWASGVCAKAIDVSKRRLKGEIVGKEVSGMG
jgi:hypothetical protein